MKEYPRIDVRISGMNVRSVVGTPNLLLGAYDLSVLGYEAAEFFVSGTATSSAEPSDSAEYTTRIVVLTPTDPARFSGTVVVEWLNVSGGIDAPAVWFMAHREIVRAGHAYVAVSAQRVGVEGGASLGHGHVAEDARMPQRYSTLRHPGDAYAYDIFSQVGRLVRERADELLGALRPKAVVAVGESQSALFLTTYVNVVDPARAGRTTASSSTRASAPPRRWTARRSSTTWRRRSGGRAVRRGPARARHDGDHRDRPGRRGAGGLSCLARQPDSDRLRTWEIPGTAHADNYTIKVGFIDSGSAPLADLVAALRADRAR